MPLRHARWNTQGCRRAIATLPPPPGCLSVRSVRCPTSLVLWCCLLLVLLQAAAGQSPTPSPTSRPTPYAITHCAAHQCAAADALCDSNEGCISLRQSMESQLASDLDVPNRAYASSCNAGCRSSLLGSNTPANVLFNCLDSCLAATCAPPVKCPVVLEQCYASSGCQAVHSCVLTQCALLSPDSHGYDHCVSNCTTTATQSLSDRHSFTAVHSCLQYRCRRGACRNLTLATDPIEGTSLSFFDPTLDTLEMMISLAMDANQDAFSAQFGELGLSLNSLTMASGTIVPSTGKLRFIGIDVPGGYGPFYTDQLNRQGRFTITLFETFTFFTLPSGEAVYCSAGLDGTLNYLDLCDGLTAYDGTATDYFCGRGPRQTCGTLAACDNSEDTLFNVPTPTAPQVLDITIGTKSFSTLTMVGDVVQVRSSNNLIDGFFHNSGVESGGNCGLAFGANLTSTPVFNLTLRSAGDFDAFAPCVTGAPCEGPVFGSFSVDTLRGVKDCLPGQAYTGVCRNSETDCNALAQANCSSPCSWDGLYCRDICRSAADEDACTVIDAPCVFSTCVVANCSAIDPTEEFQYSVTCDPSSGPVASRSICDATAINPGCALRTQDNTCQPESWRTPPPSFPTLPDATKACLFEFGCVAETKLCTANNACRDALAALLNTHGANIAACSTDACISGFTANSQHVALIKAALQCTATCASSGCLGSRRCPTLFEACSEVSGCRAAANCIRGCTKAGSNTVEYRTCFESCTTNLAAQVDQSALYTFLTCVDYTCAQGICSSTSAIENTFTAAGQATTFLGLRLFAVGYNYTFQDMLDFLGPTAKTTALATNGYQTDEIFVVANGTLGFFDRQGNFQLAPFEEGLFRLAPKGGPYRINGFYSDPFGEGPPFQTFTPERPVFVDASTGLPMLCDAPITGTLGHATCTGRVTDKGFPTPYYCGSLASDRQPCSLTSNCTGPWSSVVAAETVITLADEGQQQETRQITIKQGDRVTFHALTNGVGVYDLTQSCSKTGFGAYGMAIGDNYTVSFNLAGQYDVGGISLSRRFLILTVVVQPLLSGSCPAGFAYFSSCLPFSQEFELYCASSGCSDTFNCDSATCTPICNKLSDSACESHPDCDFKADCFAKDCNVPDTFVDPGCVVGNPPVSNATLLCSSYVVYPGCQVVNGSACVFTEERAALPTQSPTQSPTLAPTAFIPPAVDTCERSVCASETAACQADSTCASLFIFNGYPTLDDGLSITPKQYVSQCDTACRGSTLAGNTLALAALDCLETCLSVPCNPDLVCPTLAAQCNSGDPGCFDIFQCVHNTCTYPVGSYGYERCFADCRQPSHSDASLLRARALANCTKVACSLGECSAMPLANQTNPASTFPGLATSIELELLVTLAMELDQSAFGAGAAAIGLTLSTSTQTFAPARLQSGGGLVLFRSGRGTFLAPSPSGPFLVTLALTPEEDEISPPIPQLITVDQAGSVRHCTAPLVGSANHPACSGLTTGDGSSTLTPFFCGDAADARQPCGTNAVCDTVKTLYNSPAQVGQTAYNQSMTDLISAAQRYVEIKAGDSVTFFPGSVGDGVGGLFYFNPDLDAPTCGLGFGRIFSKTKTDPYTITPLAPGRLEYRTACEDPESCTRYFGSIDVKPFRNPLQCPAGTQYAGICHLVSETECGDYSSCSSPCQLDGFVCSDPCAAYTTAEACEQDFMCTFSECVVSDCSAVSGSFQYAASCSASADVLSASVCSSRMLAPGCAEQEGGSCAASSWRTPAPANPTMSPAVRTCIFDAGCTVAAEPCLASSSCLEALMGYLAVHGEDPSACTSSSCTAAFVPSGLDTGATQATATLLATVVSCLSTCSVRSCHAALVCPNLFASCSSNTGCAAMLTCLENCTTVTDRNTPRFQECRGACVSQLSPNTRSLARLDSILGCSEYVCGVGQCATKIPLASLDPLNTTEVTPWLEVNVLAPIENATQSQMTSYLSPITSDQIFSSGIEKSARFQLDGGVFGFFDFQTPSIYPAPQSGPYQLLAVLFSQPGSDVRSAPLDYTDSPVYPEIFVPTAGPVELCLAAFQGELGRAECSGATTKAGVSTPYYCGDYLSAAQPCSVTANCTGPWNLPAPKTVPVSAVFALGSESTSLDTINLVMGDSLSFSFAAATPADAAMVQEVRVYDTSPGLCGTTRAVFGKAGLTLASTVTVPFNRDGYFTFQVKVLYPTPAPTSAPTTFATGELPPPPTPSPTTATTAPPSLQEAVIVSGSVLVSELLDNECPAGMSSALTCADSDGVQDDVCLRSEGTRCEGIQFQLGCATRDGDCRESCASLPGLMSFQPPKQSCEFSAGSSCLYYSCVMDVCEVGVGNSPTFTLLSCSGSTVVDSATPVCESPVQRPGCDATSRTGDKCTPEPWRAALDCPSEDFIRDPTTQLCVYCPVSLGCGSANRANCTLDSPGVCGACLSGYIENRELLSLGFEELAIREPTDCVPSPLELVPIDDATIDPLPSTAYSDDYYYAFVMERGGVPDDQLFADADRHTFLMKFNISSVDVSSLAQRSVVLALRHLSLGSVLDAASAFELNLRVVDSGWNSAQGDSSIFTAAGLDYSGGDNWGSERLCNATLAAFTASTDLLYHCDALWTVIAGLRTAAEPQDELTLQMFISVIDPVRISQGELNLATTGRLFRGREVGVDNGAPRLRIHAGAADCVLSEWSAVTPCSTTCDEGTLRERRTVLEEAVFGGSCDFALERTVPCPNNDICPSSQVVLDAIINLCVSSAALPSTSAVLKNATVFQAAVANELARRGLTFAKSKYVKLLTAKAVVGACTSARRRRRSAATSGLQLQYQVTAFAGQQTATQNGLLGLSNSSAFVNELQGSNSAFSAVSSASQQPAVVRPPCYCTGFQDSKGRVWNGAECGTFSQPGNSCPSGFNLITRKCVRNTATGLGAFGAADTSACVNAQLNQLAQTKVNASGLDSYVNNTKAATPAADDFGVADVTNVIIILSRTVETGDSVNGNYGNETQSNFVFVASVMLEVSNTIYSRGQVSSNITSRNDTLPSLVTRFASQLAKARRASQGTNNTSSGLEIAEANLIVAVYSLRNFSSLTWPLQQVLPGRRDCAGTGTSITDVCEYSPTATATGTVNMTDVSVQLPALGEFRQITITVYRNDRAFVSTQTVSYENDGLSGGEAGGVVLTPGTSIINSLVLAATLEGSQDLLGGVIRHTFPHVVDSLLLGLAQCSYWEFSNSTDALSSSNSTGIWRTDGCRRVEEESSDTLTVCECTHLTNFAVLTSVDGSASSISSSDQLALSLITYIGLGISIPCLLLCFLVYACYSKLRTVAKKVLMHLVVTLAAALLIFVFGIDQTDDAGECQAIAIMLHWFLLCAFLWMLVEGFHLYQTFCRVLESHGAKDPLVRYCIFVYGVATIIVVVCASGWSDGYGSADSCWLSTSGERLIWAFIGPLIAIVLVNMVFLVLVMRVIIRMPINVADTGTKGGPRPNERRAKGMRDLKASASFLVLLGCTWIFGLLTIGNASLAFQYLFAILNSLQGLFIFIYHCVLDPKLRSELCGGRFAIREPSEHSQSSNGRKKGPPTSGGPPKHGHAHGHLLPSQPHSGRHSTGTHSTRLSTGPSGRMTGTASGTGDALSAGTSASLSTHSPSATPSMERRDRRATHYNPDTDRVEVRMDDSQADSSVMNPESGGTDDTTIKIAYLDVAGALPDNVSDRSFDEPDAMEDDSMQMRARRRPDSVNGKPKPFYNSTVGGVQQGGGPGGADYAAVAESDIDARTAMQGRGEAVYEEAPSTRPPGSGAAAYDLGTNNTNPDVTYDLGSGEPRNDVLYASAGDSSTVTSGGGATYTLASDGGGDPTYTLASDSGGAGGDGRRLPPLYDAATMPTEGEAAAAAEAGAFRPPGVPSTPTITPSTPFALETISGFMEKMDAEDDSQPKRNKASSVKKADEFPRSGSSFSVNSQKSSTSM